ncbi:MAG: methyltransferase domain-containing protein, partial [Armatimonadetes bacterium]|nr:methyltransferase domain-containing protein [Armatimonadota bacterium]
MPNQFTDVAEVYDSLMSVVPYKLWLRYVQGLWDEHHYHPRRVLDLACGTGNVTRELRDAGYQVEGADISSAMVRVAARKLGTETRLW